jgi:hypothetical protein
MCHTPWAHDVSFLYSPSDYEKCAWMCARITSSYTPWYTANRNCRAIPRPPSDTRQTPWPGTTSIQSAHPPWRRISHRRDSTLLIIFFSGCSAKWGAKTEMAANSMVVSPSGAPVCDAAEGDCDFCSDGGGRLALGCTDTKVFHRESYNEAVEVGLQWVGCWNPLGWR